MTIFLLLLTLLFLGTIAWLAVYAVCEAWSSWSQRRYRVRFGLHTFLVISTAACATTAVVSGGGAMTFAEMVVFTAIAFPLALGMAFFADMLLRELIQLVSPTRGKRRAANHDGDESLECDSEGKPIIPDGDPTGAGDRLRERQRPKISVIRLKSSHGSFRD